MNPHADSVQQPSETFAEWLSREMPAGTVISDPAWWAPRIERAIARFGTRPAAEPSQSSSAGETWRRRAEHLDRELKAARVDVDSEIVEGQLKDFLLRFGGKYDGNGMWDVSLYLEDICQVMSALSRQAPAAPAAVDFEKWWLAEVAANGGVPIGADYKHWAKAGFELRGDARAPAAPAEAGRSDQWGRLYTTANTLVASIGYMGEIDSRADEVASLMDALHDLDGGQWMPGLTPAASPAAPTQALLGWTRYEKARKLNPAQWAELHQRNIRGENFDDMIDALPATTQPAQQDWKDAEAATIPKLTIQTRSTPTAPTWADLLFAFGGFLTSHEKRWVFSSRDDASPMVEAIREFAARECINLDATPPAEKQAAPSGEDRYWTQPAESLMGIALRQLKDESRWTEIRDLNATSFPDMGPHDYYPVGTALKMPAATPAPQDTKGDAS